MSTDNLCPYCNKAPILRKTCGGWACQWKRHVLQQRLGNKTDQTRSTRMIIKIR